MPVETSPLPDHALLARYARSGAYTDCYSTRIARHVTHEQYVNAFYTTAVFRTERFILRWAVNRPSTDEDARQLARGAATRFAAWTVEDRAPDQLLLCDYMQRTRSWLMTAPLVDGPGTQLYFGSAVVPAPGRKDMGFPFSALLGFHKLYSRILLGAARRRLERS